MSAFDVVATIQAQEGRGDELAEILRASLATVRGEEGCLRYDLHRVRRRPDELVMLERWSSVEALKAHGAAEHFQETSARLAPLLAAAPVVRVLEAVDVADPS
ncbi:putative quinol monooxygenase [Aeromicrobium sp.]|uniref:putative quinol monooxygenase n=1 Tax=Aeromicrobium sp. TaxID=1871063 RepID=UPI0040334884